MPRRLLLLSNSRDAGGEFLAWPRLVIRDFLGAADDVGPLLFVPWAGVTVSWRDYAGRATAAFAGMGYRRLLSIADVADPVAAVREAGAIVVGGGNTFHLLAKLYEARLLDAIRDRVLGDGVPYVGWSAGSVVAGPTIKTTNDMPIVAPPRLDALGLVPFQINAHYTDFHPAGFQGETRAERLAEFLAVNPGARVVGLREGTLLRVEGDRVDLVGDGGPAALFEPGQPVAELRAGDSLGFPVDGREAVSGKR
ncbi:MAG TPA: dipeptidase PepE [Gemmatimonadaceae bacterium]|nr:dipeptidase PepE [Gemmatimonadaceae bacterium]